MNSNQFLHIVLGHIHSKDAKQSVQLELTQHLQQAKKSWLTQGYSEDEAEARAVAEMGNPSTLGRSFNKLHKPKVDWFLWALFGSVLLLGFLPLFTLDTTQFTMQSTQAIITNKAIQCILGIALALLIMFIDFRKLSRFSYIFYGIGIGVLLLLTFFTTTYVNGEAVIEIFGHTIDSWHALPFLCIAWAAFLSKKTLPLPLALVIAIVPMPMIMLIPNLAVLFVYSIMIFVLFLCSNYSTKHKLFMTGSIGVLLAGFLYWILLLFKNGSLAPYQVERISAFLNPEAYAVTAGYQNILLAKIVEQAQWFGPSSGPTVHEPFTNLVLAHIIQSYGIFTALLITVLLFFILWRLLRIALSIHFTFGRLVVIGGLTIYATQLLYVTAMTLGFAPLTSLSLPFISYGMTPMILSASWVGLAFSMYRYGRFTSVTK